MLRYLTFSRKKLQISGFVEYLNLLNSSSRICTATSSKFFPSGERKKSVMNALWSWNERMKARTWKHKSLWTPWNFACFNVLTFVYSQDFCAFRFRFLWFLVQTIVRSFLFPVRLILKTRRPLVPSFYSGHTRLRAGQIPYWFPSEEELLCKDLTKVNQNSAI